MLTPIHGRDVVDYTRDTMSLHSLPYDLLLNVAQDLSLRDVHALQLTCRALRELVTTRPVFRNLAVSLLRRCRALPLSGFQRLSDLTTDQLIAAVTRAARLEHAWHTRTPKPSISSPYTDSPGLDSAHKPWYKIISAPPNEEIDWLSPITSSYSLCATKSGKVVCWDVYRDVCLAEWTPNERWELWKCRVEFDTRTVFFSMAKAIRGINENRLMEFILMKLEFPNTSLDSTGRPSAAPVFSRLATFRTIGLVMNVFLLDPAARLLSAFVWVPSSNTIGLYALLDWNMPEYIYVDTNINYTPTSNWSCILHENQIVIHCEESAKARQYFYPIDMLRKLAQASSTDPSWAPSLCAHLPPVKKLSRRFIFPSGSFPKPPPTHVIHNPDNLDFALTTLHGNAFLANAHTMPPSDPDPEDNPFPSLAWGPESAHFVRQWWPTLPTIPRLSCTVVLLADHDPITHRTRYVLAQHYFRVPLTKKKPDYNCPNPEESSDQYETLSSGNLTASSSETLSTEGQGSDSASEHSSVSDDSSDDEEVEEDDDLLRIWYVAKPFEVVCVFDGVEFEDEQDGSGAERPRPLMAVDFGHAVWIEYCNEEPPPPPPVVRILEVNGVQHLHINGYHHDQEPSEAKRLRFVSFPPVNDSWEDDISMSKQEGKQREVIGTVRTLEIPEELDLDFVETINIDQSQGAVILSVKDGRIFILCYE